MKMTKSALVFAGILGLGMIGGIGAQASVEKRSAPMEIDVEAVFISPVGYDDNDPVEAVVYGYLPNTCYSVDKTIAVKLRGGNRFGIHQYVTVREDGICGQQEDLPIHLKMVTPFTRSVVIGKLKEGDYTLEYTQNEMTHEHRGAYKKFNVSRSVAPTVDSLPYAKVESANTAAFIKEKEDVEVTLSGLLNSSCTELAKDIQVQRHDDVIALLPTVTVNSGKVCAQVLRPYEKKLNLGKKAPGLYLLHIRSAGGMSVNRVIEVVRE